jgi:hypothetical protein
VPRQRLMRCGCSCKLRPWNVASSVTIGAMPQQHHITTYDRWFCVGVNYERLPCAFTSFAFAWFSHGQQAHDCIRRLHRTQCSRIAATMGGAADMLPLHSRAIVLKAVVAFGLRKRRITRILPKACYMRGCSRNMATRHCSSPSRAHV